MKKHLITTDMLLILLSVAVFTLGLALSVSNIAYFIPVLIVFAIIAILLLFNRRRLRTMISFIIQGKKDTPAARQFTLQELALPIVALSGKNIVWYNAAFRADLLNGEDACLSPISRLVPGLDLAKVAEKGGQDRKGRQGKHDPKDQGRGFVAEKCHGSPGIF